MTRERFALIVVGWALTAIMSIIAFALNWLSYQAVQMLWLPIGLMMVPILAWPSRAMPYGRPPHQRRCVTRWAVNLVFGGAPPPDRGQP